MIEFFEPLINEDRSGLMKNIGGAMIKGTKGLA